MIIGTDLEGGGRIDIEYVNGEWILKLHTESNDVFQFKEKYSDVLEALKIKKGLEDAARNLGSLKLLYDGEGILWFKES